MIDNSLTHTVIGSAISVHTQLGPGLLESVYEECLCYKLSLAGLNIQRQKPIPLIYESIKLECGFRCDILVDNKLIIEVKAVEALADIHIAQVLTYLKLTDLKLGLLINFNVISLKQGIKRIANNL